MSFNTTLDDGRCIGSHRTRKSTTSIMIFFRSFVSAGLFFAGVAAAVIPLQAQQQPADSAPPPPMGNAEDLDNANGFRGVKFGSSMDSISGLELEQDRGSLKLYTKKDEKMLLGPALLDEIVYYFFEGKLYGVALHSADGQDSSNLLRILQLAYGYGAQPDQNAPIFFWSGKTASARFGMNPVSGAAEAFIFNNDLQAAYEKYEATSAAEAAKQL
jgi:hypothetical protein